VIRFVGVSVGLGRIGGLAVGVCDGIRLGVFAGVKDAVGEGLCWKFCWMMVAGNRQAMLGMPTSKAKNHILNITQEASRIGFCMIVLL
jgi:hypothetical protein